MKTNIEQSMKHMLHTNATVAQWGLLRVYERQNDYEQESGEATELNGQGFSKCDSDILTSLSKFLLKRGFLTTKQLGVVHRSLPKYWRQVADGLSADQLQQLLRGVVETPTSRIMAHILSPSPTTERK